MIATAGGIVANAETYGLLLRHAHTVWLKARPDDHMRRVMEQGDFRPMAQNREAMADLVAILDARSPDYARADAELDTSGDGVEQSFAKLVRLVARYLADGLRSSARKCDGKGHRSEVNRRLPGRGPVGVDVTRKIEEAFRLR